MASTSNQAVTPRSSGLGKENRGKLEIPLDFSFMNITIPADIESEEPRSTGKKLAKNSDDKYNSKCLKLNNNVISDVTGIAETVNKLLIDPMALAWIDLSINEITKIDPVFCDFPNLQILYLHGNHINDIKEADKLAGVPSLKKLCLHGNPIENNKNYRYSVIATVPQLTCFDMSPITKADRMTAASLKNHDRGKKKKRQTNED